LASGTHLPSIGLGKGIRNQINNYLQLQTGQSLSEPETSWVDLLTGFPTRITGRPKYSLNFQPTAFFCHSGVSPSGPGVVVMQLNVPNGAQPPQNPSMVQWNHCKYYSVDQRGQKPGDLYSPDSSPQVSLPTQPCLGRRGPDSSQGAFCVI
jgi:hypothetical protein